MKTKKNIGLILSIFMLTSTMIISPSFASQTAINDFTSATGIDASSSQITETWNTLVSLGTTQYLGANIGTFKLDESTLIAAAMTIGASELDNYLRTGVLSSTVSSLSGTLSTVMSSASGINLSSIIGSYTTTSNSSALSLSSALSSEDGTCNSDVADAQVEIGQNSVNNIVNTSLSDSYGFSKLSSIQSSTNGGSGFSSLSCLENLFQNSGTDIFFKPPNLGNMITKLQNWTCGNTTSIAEQIAGFSTSSDLFKTSSYGGFFPFLKMDESTSSLGIKTLGLSSSPSDYISSSFGTFSNKNSDSSISALFY